jgi:hypothetical protein
MTEGNNQQEKNLRRLLDMTDEQTAALFQLIADQPHLTAFVTKRKAFALVFGSIRRAVGWIAGFLGALWLGAEKIKAVVMFMAEQVVAFF